MATLLTETEVIKWAKLGEEFPGCTLNDIKQVERTERRERIGKDLYDALIADLEDNSSADPYESKTYSEGDKVIWRDGLIYEAKEETTREPEDISAWKLADKFQEAKYNTFWTEVLARYLSIRVLQNTAPSMEVKFSGSGAVQLQGQTFIPAKSDPIKRAQSWIETQIKICWENVVDFLEENKEEAVFQDFLGFKDSEDCAKIVEDPQSDGTTKKKTTGAEGEINGYTFY